MFFNVEVFLILPEDRFDTAPGASYS